MEAPVHPQVAVALAVALAAATAAALAVIPLSGCDEAPRPGPTLEQQAAGDPTAVIESILERCHGVLRGRKKMSNSLVELRGSAEDTAQETLLLGEGARLRVTRRNGTIDMSTPEGAWRTRPHAAAEALDETSRRALGRYRQLVSAALLAPLYAAAKVTREDPFVYTIVTRGEGEGEAEGGEAWRLTLSGRRVTEGSTTRNVLLPEKLQGPTGLIVFEEYLHTGVTHLPSVVVLGEVGRRWFRLVRSDVELLPHVFADPTSGPADRSTAIAGPGWAHGNGPGGRPAALVTVPNRRCLAFRAAATWEGRQRQIAEHGSALAAAGQEASDLDFLFDEKGQRWYAMPFRRRDGEGDGEPFVPPTGQRLVTIENERAVAVTPPRGTMAECEAAARTAIESFLASEAGRGLTPAGPLRIKPYLEPERGPPTPQQLKNLRVDFELPVR